METRELSCLDEFIALVMWHGCEVVIRRTTDRTVLEIEVGMNGKRTAIRGYMGNCPTLSRYMDQGFRKEIERVAVELIGPTFEETLDQVRNFLDSAGGKKR